MKKLHVATAAMIAAGLLAVLLPLYILIFSTPISDPDPARLAQLHLRPDFWPRAVLTFLYFPAVIAVHFLVLPPHRKTTAMLFLTGFAIFVAGNGIDAVWRSIQYLTVHGLWAEQLLNGGAGAMVAEAKIRTFSELAPAVSASFSLLFGIGRALMGIALLNEKGWLFRLAGAALILNGFWNLISVATLVESLSFLGILGSFYLWPWLLSLVLVSLAAMSRVRSLLRAP